MEINGLEGSFVAALEDSLQWLRVACPGRKDYGLKDAEQWALGYPSRPSFLDLVSYMQRVVHAKRVRERGCVCGANPCRARSVTDFLDEMGVWRPHTRVEWLRFVPQETRTPARYDIRDFVPGAILEPIIWTPPKRKKGQPLKPPPTWWKGQPIDRLAAWWDYSAADAIRGMELVDYIRNLKPVKVVYPWTSGLQTRF